MQEQLLDLTAFNEHFGWMIRNARNIQPALNEIGAMVAQELRTNIDSGGRPEPFVPSIRAKMTGGQTLRDSGTLMNSISWQVGNDNTVAVGPTAVGREHLTDPRILGALIYGTTIKPKNAEYLTFQVAGAPRTIGKSGKTLKNAQDTFHTVRTKQVTLPPRDASFFYVPPEVVTACANVLLEFLNNAR